MMTLKWIIPSPQRMWHFFLLVFMLGQAQDLCWGLARPPSPPPPPPPQEFRGVWVTSVFNLNFPSQAGLPAEVQKKELSAIVKTVRDLHLNAILLQVRPESDALYPSKLEPWSRWLSGTQGKDPGYDPLAYLIEQAHQHDIQVHAWLNPYRASASTTYKPRSPQHVSHQLKEHAHKIRQLLWMDPGALEVQDHFLAVVKDIIQRYPIDGIHLDDYFYPYPISGKNRSLPFFDKKTYQKYQQQGGTLSLADWRRHNTNTLIQRVHHTVKSINPKLQIGISPFGIARPGYPKSVQAGLNYYEECFADPLQWLQEGWVDYVAPQLYWKDQSPQSFSTLLTWWRSPEVNPHGIPVYPGIALERMKNPHHWPLQEIKKQIHLARTSNSEKPGGLIFWNINSLMQNRKNIRNLLQKILLSQR